MIQQFAFLPVDIGIGGFQVFAGFLDVTAAGGGEGDDGLAFEIVGLHEGVDDGRSGVPPLSIPVNRGSGVSRRGIYLYPWLRPAP